MIPSFYTEDILDLWIAGDLSIPRLSHDRDIAGYPYIFNHLDVSLLEYPHGSPWYQTNPDDHTSIRLGASQSINEMLAQHVWNSIGCTAHWYRKWEISDTWRPQLSCIQIYSDVGPGLAWFSEEYAKNDVNHEVFFQNSDKICFFFTWVVMCPDRTQYHCVTYPGNGGFLSKMASSIWHFNRLGAATSVSLPIPPACRQEVTGSICSNSAFSDEQQNLSFHEQTICGKLLHQWSSMQVVKLKLVDFALSLSVEMMRFFYSESMNQKSDLDELSEVYKSQHIPRAFLMSPGPFFWISISFHHPSHPRFLPTPGSCFGSEWTTSSSDFRMIELTFFIIWLIHIHRVRRISNPRHLSSKQFTGRSQAEQLSQKDSCGFPSADRASRYPRLPFKITKKRCVWRKY